MGVKTTQIRSVNVRNTSTLTVPAEKQPPGEGVVAHLDLRKSSSRKSGDTEYKLVLTMEFKGGLR